MSVEGHVDIDVRRGQSPAVQVVLTQPGDVARILRGKTSAEARCIIPALYSVCGKAQAHAALLALHAATGQQPQIADLTAVQCLTEMESLRENALRIALDWTRHLGEQVEPSGLRPLMRLVPALESGLQSGSVSRDSGSGPGFARDLALRVVDEADALVADLIFGEPLRLWQEREDVDDVRDWAAAGTTPAARLLHRIHAQGLAQAGAISLHKLAPLDGKIVLAWLAAGPEQALPLTCGAPVPETTLLAHHAGDRRIAGTVADSQTGHGLWARMTARLIELSQAPARMRALIEGRIEPRSGRVLGETIGMGEVAAARGTLMHVAAVEDGRITRYRVLPPTSWNFGADGAAGRAVESIACEYGADARMLAELMVNAIDPCVACNVRLH